MGKDVKTELAEGKPSKRITEYAEENTNDLIVMGREGQGQASLKNRLLGGVAEKILHSSEAPVLVVPDEEEESIEDSYDEILFPTDGSENAEKATKYCSPFARQ
ncbi:MAG: universal stress protein, partial [Halobacteria archaeon]|nr:universal stress protein [Halobacteria archaeon]